MKLAIQPRDIQIMKFVFACRVVSYDQIIRRHFPKTKEIVARRRLRKLSKAGFLKVGVLEHFGQIVRVVQPLPQAWPLICEKWSLVVDSPHFKSESLEHDVRMAEIFMKIEKLKCFRSFFTENLLQSSLALAEDPRFRSLAKLQADGALTITDAAGNLKIYGVEFELSKKSPEGYRQKLINYYLAKGIDGVLYVSPKREIQSLLTRIEDEIGKDRTSLVWFSSEDSALTSTGKIIFRNRKGQTLELK